MTKKLESWLIGLKHLKELGEEMIPQALKELHEKLEHLQKYIHSGGLPAPAKAKTVLAQTGQKTVSYAEEARLIESGVPKKIRHAGKYAQNVANTADVARIKKVYTYESGFPNLLDNSVTDAATGASYFNKISAASGPIRNEMLEGETLFRAFGPKGATRGVAVNESNAIGAFWGRGSVPKSAEEWRRKFAVMDEWNRNGWLSMVHIPAGVKIPACTSTVSEQFGKTISGQYLEGGGKQAFVTALFEAQIVEATKKLIRRGGGKGKVMMANGNFIEVEVRQSSWKKINGKIGYGDAVIPGASMTERLGIKEIQLKVRDESGKQTVAAGNRQQNAAEGAEAH